MPANEFSGLVRPYNANVLAELGVEERLLHHETLGVEIELEYTGRFKRWKHHDPEQLISARREEAVNVLQEASAVMAKHGITYLAKHDGSLLHGFEMATAPLPFNTTERIARAYSDLISVSGGEPSATCGLHVHINRNAFLHSEALHLWTWLWSQAEMVERVAGRQRSRLYRYASPFSTPRVWDLTRYTFGRENYLGSVHRNTFGPHHASVGLGHRGTGELRIMAAPRGYAICVQRLDTVVKSVLFVRHVLAQSEATERDPRPSVSWKAFLEWVGANHRTSHAWAYLRKREERLRRQDGRFDLCPRAADGSITDITRREPTWLDRHHGEGVSSWMERRVAHQTELHRIERERNRRDFERNALLNYNQRIANIRQEIADLRARRSDYSRGDNLYGRYTRRITELNRDLRNYEHAGPPQRREPETGRLYPQYQSLGQTSRSSPIYPVQTGGLYGSGDSYGGGDLTLQNLTQQNLTQDPYVIVPSAEQVVAEEADFVRRSGNATLAAIHRNLVRCQSISAEEADFVRRFGTSDQTELLARRQSQGLVGPPPPDEAHAGTDEGYDDIDLDVADTDSDE